MPAWGFTLLSCGQSVKCKAAEAACSIQLVSLFSTRHQRGGYLDRAGLDMDIAAASPPRVLSCLQIQPQGQTDGHVACSFTQALCRISAAPGVADVICPELSTLYCLPYCATRADSRTLCRRSVSGGNQVTLQDVPRDAPIGDSLEQGRQHNSYQVFSPWVFWPNLLTAA